MGLSKSLLILFAFIGAIYGVLYILAYPMFERSRHLEKIIALSKSPTPSVETVYVYSGAYNNECGRFDHEMEDDFFSEEWNEKEVSYYTGTSEREEKGYFRRREISHRNGRDYFYKEIIFDLFGYCGGDPVEKTGCSSILFQKFPGKELVTYKNEDDKICINPLAGGIAIYRTVRAEPLGTLCRGRDKYTGDFLGRVYYSERRYYDKKKKPMLNADGVAMVKCRKRNGGKFLEFRYYGVADEPVHIRRLAEQVRILSDNTGNLTSIEFLGEDDKPMNVRACGCVFSKMETDGEEVVLKTVEGKPVGWIDLPRFRQFYEETFGGNRDDLSPYLR